MGAGAGYAPSVLGLACVVPSLRNSGLKGLSIADIKVPAGKGRMRVGDLVQDIGPGDAVMAA
jgi:hypothetical protein